jgi:hypothetical protein
LSGAGISSSGIQVSLDKSTVVKQTSLTIGVLEPIGSTKPKFSEDVNSKSINRVEGSAVTLVCPAQGSPMPAFRLVNYIWQKF